MKTGNSIGIILATLMISVVMLCRPAMALTVGPNANSIDITNADVGKSFAVNWASEIGNCQRTPELSASSVWEILGISATQITLNISLTNTSPGSIWHLLKTAITSFGVGVSPNASAAFVVNGSGDIFDTVGHGSGPHQSFPGGVHNIDACFSSANGCTGGSLWSGLQPDLTDVLTVALSGDFSSGLITLDLFPMKFKTKHGSYTLPGVVSAVPLPATLPLLGAALVGFGAFRRRKATNTVR
jgi:hypothetical protein